MHPNAKKADADSAGFDSLKITLQAGRRRSSELLIGHGRNKHRRGMLTRHATLKLKFGAERNGACESLPSKGNSAEQDKKEVEYTEECVLSSDVCRTPNGSGTPP